MPEEEKGTPEPATPESPAPTGDPVTPASEPQKDWEASYKGLQSAFQKLQKKSETEVSELAMKLKAATEQVEAEKAGGVSKDSQLTVLQQEVAKLTENLAELSGEKTKADALAARQRLVLNEFPDLAMWEGQGLLPGGESEDEMREAFDKFRKTLTGQVGQEVKRSLSGASPAGSGKTSPSTADEVGSEDFVWQQMTKFAGRDQGEFEKWQSQWDAIQAKKVKA